MCVSVQTRRLPSIVPSTSVRLRGRQTFPLCRVSCGTIVLGTGTTNTIRYNYVEFPIKEEVSYPAQNFGVEEGRLSEYETVRDNL